MTEWLDDAATICCGSHFAIEVRIVSLGNGAYVKMCKECYQRDYPGYDYDELERA